MANKDISLFVKKLQDFYSNTSNNGKLPKVNTTTGAIDAVDPASFAASGASGSTGTYLVANAASLPLTGLTKGALGLIPLGSNYEMYVWSSENASGNLSDWKRVSSTSATLPPYTGTGFVYGAVTTTPIDAAVGNNFLGLAYSSGISQTAEGLLANEYGVIREDVATSATRFAASTANQISYDQVIEFYIPTGTESPASFTSYLGFGEGAVSDSGNVSNGYTIAFTLISVNDTSFQLGFNGSSNSILLDRGKTYRLEIRYMLELLSSSQQFIVRANVSLYDSSNGNQFAITPDYVSAGPVDLIINGVKYQYLSSLYPTNSITGFVDINPRFFFAIRKDMKLKRVIVSKNW